MSNYFKNIGIEELAGLLGIIIASIALGWNILNEIRKTPRAKVNAMIASIIMPGSPAQDKNDYFSIVITNIGTRPIKINGIAFYSWKWWWPPFKKSHYIILVKQLPGYLKDSEEHIENIPYTSKKFQELLDKDIQVLYAYDSAGRIHKISRLRMIKFKKEIKRYIKRKASSKTS